MNITDIDDKVRTSSGLRNLLLMVSTAEDYYQSSPEPSHRAIQRAAEDPYAWAFGRGL